MITYLEELASVIITIIKSIYAAVKSTISTNGKVSWHKWRTRAITFEDHLSLEECTLWDSSIDLLWLSDLDGFVLKEVEDSALSNSEILET